MALHKSLTVGDIHIPYNWTYADQSAREGASGFDSSDVGKFARQTDNNSIWMLTATTPTWVQVGGSGSDPDAIHDNVSGEINAITEKSTLVDGDLVVIEDSAASYAKKKVQVVNLPAGAPSGPAGGDLGGTYPNPTVDDGADSTAIHDNEASEISAITEKTDPVDADLLLMEDSADSNNKKKIQLGNMFGGNYQRQENSARAETTGENTVRLTLTTGALTGTFRVGFGCVIDCNNKVTHESLYNLTDTTELWVGRPKPPTVTDTDEPVSGVVEITLTGSSKTLQLRWGNASGGTDTIGIQHAFIEFWRVS